MRVASRIGVGLILVLLLVTGCHQTPHPPADARLTIQLRWIKGYSRETKTKVDTGLSWALSFLGAVLPQNSEPFSWQGNVVTLDLDAAGVLPETRSAWMSVLTAMKSSDEYRKTGAIDIGRFLLLTLCSSHQYFALTGAARTFADFQSAHGGPFKLAAVVESDIARGNRLLQVSDATRLEQVAFVAFEGGGSIADGSFEKSEIETIDFMPNGQLRFALFDLQGNAKTSASPEHTGAGKPSKCLWCHEIRLQPPFKNTTSVPGFLSAEQLRRVIRDRMEIVSQYRSELKSTVDFRRTDDHTLAELLYLAFAEPSAQRLSVEWGESIEAVRNRLATLKTHRQSEFSFLGESLYDRDAVDLFAPYQSIRVPSNVREASNYEPELIRSDTPP
jgi:hypothetical protein